MLEVYEAAISRGHVLGTGQLTVGARPAPETASGYAWGSRIEGLSSRSSAAGRCIPHPGEVPNAGIHRNGPPMATMPIPSPAATIDPGSGAPVTGSKLDFKPAPVIDHQHRAIHDHSRQV